MDSFATFPLDDISAVMGCRGIYMSKKARIGKMLRIRAYSLSKAEPRGVLYVAFLFLPTRMNFFPNARGNVLFNRYSVSYVR